MAFAAEPAAAGAVVGASSTLTERKSTSAARAALSSW